MRSRARFVVLAVLAALLATACGSSQPSDVAATVNGEKIPIDTFERIVAKRSEGLGLEGQTLDQAEAATDAGLLDVSALSTAIQQVVQQPEPTLPSDQLPDIRDAYVQSIGQGTVDSAKEDLGWSDQQWQDLFDAAATAEYNALLAQVPPTTPLDRSSQVAAAQRGVLSVLIQVTLINQVFADKDLTLEDKAVEDQYQNVLDQSGGDETALENQLSGLGFTIADYRDIILTAVARQQAIVNSFVDVTDEELRAAYQDGLDSGRFVVADVSHILIQPETADGETQPSQEAIDAARQQAEDLLQQLKDGADFAELAKQYSADTGSAANGGSLGGEQPVGGYVDEFKNAVLDAPIGEVIGPVQTQFGFHLIRVDSRRELSFDEAKSQLQSDNQSQASQQASAEVQQKMQEADVEVPERFGFWDASTGTVVAEKPTPAPAPSGTGQ